MARILVIDDSADLLDMMRLILAKRGGHQVVLSADPADGLSKALADPPDLAIIDVMMPGITGYDIVRRLREQPQTAEMPILILTARGQPIDRETALQVGADEHMAKPVMPADLLAKVDELLARRRGAPGEGAGRVLTLLSLRGGVGVSTLVANLAVVLASGEPDVVALFDMNPASGQLALHLRVKAERTWASLRDTSPDPALLEQITTRHASGIHIVAAPFSPLYADRLTGPTVEAVLAFLRGRFEAVLVDAPPLLNEAAMAALNASDLIFLVLAPEVGAVQAALAALHALREVRERLFLVLNQVQERPPLPAAAVERALKRSPDALLPFEPAHRTALARGIPLALEQPQSPYVQALHKMAVTAIERLAASGG